MTGVVATRARAVVDRWGHEARRAGQVALVGPLALALAGTGFLLLVHAVHQPVARIAGSLPEAVIPLVAAIAVAGLVGGDPAVELQLSLPVSYRATLVRRFAVTLTCAAAVAAAASTAYTGLRVWPAPAGALVTQLAWLVPLATLCALAAAIAALTASGRAAAGVVGGLWVAQEYFKAAFIAKTWSQPLYLFATARVTGLPYRDRGHLTGDWFANRAWLAVAAVVAAVAAWVGLCHPYRLLRKGEGSW